MTRAPNVGTSETIGMAMRVSKIDAVHCGHENPLLRVNQISNPEILLRDISKAHVRFFAESFRACGSDPREELSLSRRPPRRTVPRCVKVHHQISLEFSMEPCPWFFWMKGISFKRCVTLTRLQMSLVMKLFCFCGGPRNMTAAQSQK